MLTFKSVPLDLSLLNSKKDDISEIEHVRKAILNENHSFMYQIDIIKNNLDKMTDVLENESLLSCEKIDSLIGYLDTNSNYLASLIK